MAPMAKNGRRFSPWVLVGVAIVAVVLFGVGGGLISAFDACLVDPYTTVCSYGTYYAGLGFLSLGSLCSLSWFVLLIIFLVSRPPPPVQYNLGTGYVNGGNFGTTQLSQPQPQPQPYTQPQEYYGGQVQYPAPAVPAAPSKEVYTTIQPSRQNAPAPPYPLAELESTPVSQPQQHTDRICSHCEAVMQSSFCQRCGSAATTI